MMPAAMSRTWSLVGDLAVDHLRAQLKRAERLARRRRGLADVSSVIDEPLLEAGRIIDHWLM